ncbi:MAG: hypothetical protein MZU84_09310 [Sphingobacterium sp.]|nr:hypothetical protein [Sphingobacterium sp.]
MDRPLLLQVLVFPGQPPVAPDRRPPGSSSSSWPTRSSKPASSRPRSWPDRPPTPGRWPSAGWPTSKRAASPKPRPCSKRPSSWRPTIPKPISAWAASPGSGTTRTRPSAACTGPSARRSFTGRRFTSSGGPPGDNGRVCDLSDIYERAEECYRRKSRPLPSWFTNGMSQIGRIPGGRLFQMEGRFDHLAVPLVENPDPRIRIRMIALRLEGRGEYLFDIDSASADFLTLSPLLAEELGLAQTGSSAGLRRGFGRGLGPLFHAGQGRARRDRVPERTGHGLGPPPFQRPEERPARHGPAQALQRYDRRRAEGHGPLSPRPAGPPRRAHRPVGRGRGRPALSLRRDGRRGVRGRRPGRALYPRLRGGHEPRGRNLLQGSPEAEGRSGPDASAPGSRGPRARSPSTASTACRSPSAPSSSRDRPSTNSRWAF